MSVMLPKLVVFIKRICLAKMYYDAISKDNNSDSVIKKDENKKN